MDYNLEFLLIKKETKKTPSKIEELYEKSKKAYLALEYSVGRQKIQSSIQFLNNLEQGIRDSCGKTNKLNADIHAIPTLKGIGNYNRCKLSQELKKRAIIINELLHLSYRSSNIVNRWEYVEFQVCHFRFYKNLNCPVPYRLKNNKHQSQQFYYKMENNL